MTSLRQLIVSQFRQPHGFAGAIAGRIMAWLASNRLRSSWTVELLDVHNASEVLETGCAPVSHLSSAHDAPEFGCAFDTVFSVNVIQFLPDAAEAFSRIHTLLKPNGIVATTYQPRSAMTERIETAMINAGLSSIRRHELPLMPVPPVCVTGTA